MEGKKYVIKCQVRPPSAVLAVLLILAACSNTSQPDAGFAGTWVMTVADRVFIVLTLESEGGKYSASLERPVKLTATQDGRTFSNVSRESRTDRVTVSAPTQGSIHLVSAPADGGGDADEFDFSLTGNEGRLKFSGAPFEPWPMSRYAGAGTPHVWTGWEATRSYPLDTPYVAPNPQMAEIYKADQAPRQSMKSYYANAKQIDKDDALRRQQVRALVDTGQLHAGEDFRLAAMVFQHGSDPRDHLFAHTLALIALEKGDRSASWIAAASLDGYLRSIDRQQIFGLQFEPNGTGRQPFDGELVSDALRKELGVPTLAEQQVQMQQQSGK